MLAVDIPGVPPLRLEHLVLDYNGTLAIDGRLIGGVAHRIRALAASLVIHIVTGDTFGGARAGVEGLPCALVVLPPEGQARTKLDYVERLGAHATVCIGNGSNDRLMLQACALGIAVLQHEGAASPAIHAAGVLVPGICDALDLLIHPLRLTATLRT